MSNIILIPLILVLCLALVCPDARADGASYATVNYVVAGLLFVDVGASIANGLALTAGRPNRLNGYFGVAAGVISLGLVAANYAMTNDKELRDSFAIVFGTAGTASLVLGAMNVRRSPPTREGAVGISGVHLFPYLTVERDRRCGMGVGAQITF
ncbi:MAG: hypothetical protein NTX17_05650 [Candidatus Eisenbacteria bacterium]|nr:hypothetical protein [Candidatus Eisenbacteria bacterium]